MRQRGLFNTNESNNHLVKRLKQNIQHLKKNKQNCKHQAHNQKSTKALRKKQHVKEIWCSWKQLINQILVNTELRIIVCSEEPMDLSILPLPFLQPTPISFHLHHCTHHNCSRQGHWWSYIVRVNGIFENAIGIFILLGLSAVCAQKSLYMGHMSQRKMQDATKLGAGRLHLSRSAC